MSEIAAESPRHVRYKAACGQSNPALTTDPARVTCARCLKIMGRAA